MASINGVSSKNGVSSLYNSSKVISGLASGLDTEGMIEGLVQSYQNKITSLSQKATKVEWKQDAYRSIIAKMNSFTSKYTSFSSSTNLLSNSFFSSAINVATQGKYADKVSASGKTSSDITLDRVKQLATSAQFRTKGNLIAGDGKSIEAIKGLDLNGKTTLGSLDGSLSLTYGSNTITLNFDEVADQEALAELKEKNPKMTETEALAALINQKLDGQKISFSGGGSADAKDRIEVKADGMNITFSDKSTAGNSVYLSSASGNVAETLGLDLENAKEDKPASIKLSYDFSTTKDVDNAKYLSEKSMNLSLDGSVKQIKLPKITGSDGDYRIVDADGKALDYTAENYTKVLNDALNKAYKGKVTVENKGTDGELKLRFNVQEGSDLIINTDVGETLGIGRASTSYLNTSKTLEDLLGKEKLEGLTAAKDKDGKDLLDDKGNKLYEFKINDVVIGQYSKDTKLSEILSDINANKEAGMKVSYSQTTKNFTFTSSETGADSEVKISGGLAEAMFGTTEISDQSGSSFAESYGLGWLKDGKSTTINFEIPNGGGQTSFNITKDTSIQEVVDNLNDAYQQKYNFSYNKYSGQIEARDMKSGALTEFNISDYRGKDVEFDESKAPDVDYTPGQDAEFTVTVNGETINMKRASNSVNIDGLTINMKDTFDGAKNEDGTDAVSSTGKPLNAVSFKATTDSDKIVDAVKSMIADYNEMMGEIKKAYATLPYQKSSGAFADYEPLTDEDRAGMSESAIERYEEKAKQGILFGDRNLSALYDKMRNVFTIGGEDGALLRKMGITSTYSTSDGAMTISLDEKKLREMLDSDPDAVASVFTKSQENGSATNGIMQNMKNTLDTYGRTTGATKGILVEQAGTPLSSLSLMNNTWQKEIEKINTDIEKWQDKLSAQVDRYTQQFSRLEQLINQMNSQSSTLMGMMGG
ncbi:MAG: flagellar filament capping protein FliD [Oscillospiraceae bacterium]|nr:flagellar filament capping protein FliD [Oscillospiraceae bacterium]